MFELFMDLFPIFFISYVLLFGLEGIFPKKHITVNYLDKDGKIVETRKITKDELLAFYSFMVGKYQEEKKKKRLKKVFHSLGFRL